MNENSSEIHAVEFSPDGQWLASVQADSTYLWDVGAQTVKAITSFPASAPVFSGDGSLFAYGGPHFVHLATLDGNVIDEVQTNATFAFGISISPEHDLLAIGDGSILRLRDITTKNEVAINLVGDAGLLDTEKEIDALDGEEFEESDMQKHGIYGIRFVPGGQVVSFIYQHRIGFIPLKSLRDALNSRVSPMHDTTSTDSLVTWRAIPDLIGDPAIDRTYSFDQRILICQMEDDDANTCIQLMDVETLEVAAQIQVTNVDVSLVSFALSPDNCTLAVQTDDGFMRFFDVSSAHLLGTYALHQPGSEAGVGQVAGSDNEGEGIDFEEMEDPQYRDVAGDISWSPDGKMLAAGGMTLLRYFDPSSFAGSEPDFSLKVFDFAR